MDLDDKEGGRLLPYLAMRFLRVWIIYVKFGEIWFLARCQMAKTFEDGSEAPSELHQIRNLSDCSRKPARSSARLRL